ncbi:MAG: C69 family dipeptidase [Myxococcales bacterium]|nr:C69 family dipeptidase [Myxococcales bacterium]
MCDTAVQIGPEGVLFAKNSDRDPNEGQVLDWQPRQRHAPGTRLRCTWIDIPQVPETAAVLLSRPFWMWGAEIGANEHGVVIGNEAVFTRQPYAESGLLGMDLLRLALERATTAEAAVEILVTLLETHGQGGGCGHEDRTFTYHNSFLVADAAGAIVLETAGRRWATERVTRGARSISNGLTIEPFAREHSDRIRSRAASCDQRRARSEALASAATGPADMMKLLRDHGPERGHAPRYSRVNGAMGAPCVHAGGMVANSQTTASWVSALSPGIPNHWVTGTASPCASLFKPILVTEPLDLGPPPTDRSADGSLWWRWERLARAALRDPDRLLPLFAAERDALEAEWLAHPPEPAKAFAEAERRLARWEAQVSAASARDRRPVWARRYWKRRNERAGLVLA